jgi:hypothetical protein
VVKQARQKAISCTLDKDGERETLQNPTKKYYKNLLRLDVTRRKKSKLKVKPKNFRITSEEEDIEEGGPNNIGLSPFRYRDNLMKE